MKLFKIIFEAKWVQGYKYLDHCGKALIKLENELSHKEWITSEFRPTGGSIKNPALDMLAVFDSNRITVIQEIAPNKEEFISETAKIYDILRTVFEIEQINIPAIRIIAQKGFEEEKQANDYILKLKHINIDEKIYNAMGNDIETLNYTICTTAKTEIQGILQQVRKRLNISAIKQRYDAPFDERLLHKVKYLNKDQQYAMKALLKLRKKMPKVPHIAAQFDMEQVIEAKLSAKLFDIPSFIAQAWNWAEQTLNKIT